MEKVKISKRLMAALKLNSRKHHGDIYRPIFKVTRLQYSGAYPYYYTLSTIKILYQHGQLDEKNILYTEIIDVL